MFLKIPINVIMKYQEQNIIITRDFDNVANFSLDRVKWKQLKKYEQILLIIFTWIRCITMKRFQDDLAP